MPGSGHHRRRARIIGPARGTELALHPSQTLLHYRLVEKVGEGGMGVVWKAVDTTLDREVAIKVLPAVLAGDTERLARFEREAKLLGSLNHPNIATIHGLHADGEIRFLSMELVDGDDLSERLERGPIPPDEAIGIAKQIADGLEAAHEAGVIHRDLKPANVKIGTDGRVKVLDFGLARAFDTSPASGSGEVSPTMSPTLTSAGTVAGMILGTAAYMSPEQARGHHVDNRADVWAFGVVLYEMLSGRAAFKGDTVSDTLASVLKLDPDFDALPATIPHRIRTLVTRCLQKDRKHRLHHIADARIALEETIAGVPDIEAPSDDAAKKSRTRERILWLAAVALAAIVAANVALKFQPDPEPPPHRKLTLALDGADPEKPSLREHSISPDGKSILYVNGEKVFVRKLDDWESREITAAAGPMSVFWSDDSASIGFIIEKTMSRVSADGSGSSLITELPARGNTVNGVAWGPDGTIVMASFFYGKPGLYTVSDRGGEIKELFLAEDGEHFHDPSFLPDGSILASVHEEDGMRLTVFTEGALKTLLDVGEDAHDLVYSSTGHVLYTRTESNEGIWAAPFSVETLELTGEPFLIEAGAGGVSVSRDGTMTYGSFDVNRNRTLVWVDREGEVIETVGQPQELYDFPALSPDGSRIAIESGEQGEGDIWILDITRGAKTRLTQGEAKESDVAWMPDGKHVVYRVVEEDQPSRIVMARVDGGGEPQTLVEGGLFSVSFDGKFLVYQKHEETPQDDLWYLELGKKSEPQPILRTPADEDCGRISPDGAYIAYDSDESGEDQIYLKRFPSGEGKWPVSIDGGYRPRWSAKGDELFWINGGDLMVVDVQLGTEPTLGNPRVLFSYEPRWMLEWLEFDMTADAQRFLLVAPEEEIDWPNEIRLVENWFVE